MPVPAVGVGQVRIRVEAAGVNPVDAATRSGALAEAGLMPARDIVGIGWDAAGVIDEVGPLAEGFAAGDRVIGLGDRLDASLGTYAEYVVLDASAVAPISAGVSAVEAATLPLNGLTAVQALDLLGLEEGATVLVTGAAGAVGGYAVELAAQRGLRVVGTGRPEDERLVRDLGARWFIAGSDDLGAVVREPVPGGVDGALDAVVIGIGALGAVRNRGAFVAVVAGAAPTPLRGIRVANVWIASDGGGLRELATLAGDARLALRVASTYPLEEARHAHERLAKGGLRGRLVLTP